MIYGNYYRMWNEGLLNRVMPYKPCWVAISDLESPDLPPIAGTDAVAVVKLLAKYELDYDQKEVKEGEFSSN